MLDRPLEIYRPFTPEETKVLRGFVVSARIVGGMRFFSQVPSEASFNFEQGKGAWAEMQEPDEQDLRAAITELRKVYLDDLDRVLERRGHRFAKHEPTRRESSHRAARTLIETLLLQADVVQAAGRPPYGAARVGRGLRRRPPTSGHTHAMPPAEGAEVVGAGGLKGHRCRLTKHH